MCSFGQNELSTENYQKIDYIYIRKNTVFRKAES